ncbi:Trehalose import ATP-binding protein SugC [archaeon HR01]|nr:Trehalose import ATP-binding protein SugC [archaeon HR01]
MADVKLVKVSKRFGRQVAVKDLSLEVSEGSFTCLLGPSGCGKTTTLRMVAGLEKPDSGDIYIGGVRVNDIPAYERDIAMVFQFYAIYPGMTVFENMAFPLKQRKWSKNDISRRVREIAEILQISHLLDKDAMSLTVGEKQRVALGRAMVRDPKVFLLDEPLTNLDARLRARMRVELKMLHQRIKTTTIYVTHDQLEAMTLADKIGVMNLGELQQYDTPENLYNRPANVFVAGFIGTPTMNLVECRVSRRGGGQSLAGEGFTFSADSLNGRLRDLPEGYEVIMGLRPTEIVVDRAERGAGLIGKVEVLEPIGDKSILDISVGKTLFRAVVPRTFDIRVGETVSLYVESERVHIFDKNTGVRL